jgi:hypothetical protein
VQAMALPHASDPFPELSKQVRLPRLAPAAEGRRGGRRRTRRTGGARRSE